MYLENPDGITWRVKKVLAVGLGESVPMNHQKERTNCRIVSETEARNAARNTLPTSRKATSGAA